MRRGRSRQPGWLPILLFVSLLLGLAVSAAAWEGGHGWRHLLDEEGEEEDVSGPIVRDSEPAPAEGPMSEIVLKANATEKKTIAQIIDEALEQEFPEEKQEGIGKNYNETAKNADVCAPTAAPTASCWALHYRCQWLAAVHDHLLKSQSTRFHNAPLTWQCLLWWPCASVPSLNQASQQPCQISLILSLNL